MTKSATEAAVHDAAKTILIRMGFAREGGT